MMLKECITSALPHTVCVPLHDVEEVMVIAALVRLPGQMYTSVEELLDHCQRDHSVDWRVLQREKSESRL